MAAEGADLDCQLVIDVGVRVEGSMAATTDQRIVREHWEIINLDEWGTHDAESWGAIRAAGSDLEVGHELHLHQRPYDRFEFEMVYLLSHECIMFHISIDSQSIFFYSLTWNSIFHWAFAQISDLNIWNDLDSYIGANIAAMFHTWLVWLIKRLLKYIQNIIGNE